MPSVRTSKGTPARSARRAASTSVVAPSSICGAASPTARRTVPWDKDTIVRRRIHDQRRYRDLRPSAGAARRARSGRSGGQVLAGVRRCRQGEDPGALAAFTPGRPAGHRRTADLRGGLRLASGHPGTRGAEAGVGAGHRARLPQRDLRVPGRGARAPDHRQVARHASSPRRSLPRSGCTPGSGCPRSRRRTSPRFITPIRSRWRR